MSDVCTQKQDCSLLVMFLTLISAIKKIALLALETLLLSKENIMTFPACGPGVPQ
jgi:hypothetical protein